jgi:hypothetical protein
MIIFTLTYQKFGFNLELHLQVSLSIITYRRAVLLTIALPYVEDDWSLVFEIVVLLNEFVYKYLIMLSFILFVVELNLVTIYSFDFDSMLVIILFFVIFTNFEWIGIILLRALFFMTFARYGNLVLFLSIFILYITDCVIFFLSRRLRLMAHEIIFKVIKFYWIVRCL